MLAPDTVTDINGDSTEASFDALGRVTKLAIIGSAGEGDTLSAPTTKHSYEQTRYESSGLPARVRTEVRETHADSGSRWLTSYAYTAGSGALISTKVGAEPGLAVELDGSGQPNMLSANPRRWTAADPAGMVDGVNLYRYCRGNPVGLQDPDGREPPSSTPPPAGRYHGYRRGPGPAPRPPTEASTSPLDNPVLDADKLHDESSYSAGFAEAVGILFHESFHGQQWPTIGTKSEPAWYKAEAERFRGARNREGVAAGRHAPGLLDEAQGKYIDKTVTAYLNMPARVAKAIDAGGSAKEIDSLRNTYNKPSPTRHFE